MCGTIHNTHYDSTNVDSQDVTNLFGRDVSISFTDPEITRLRSIIQTMQSELDSGSTEEILHVWLDPWDANDKAFYDKLFWVMHYCGVYHDLFHASDEVYIPTSMEVGFSNNYMMLVHPAHNDTAAFPLTNIRAQTNKAAGSGSLVFPDEPMNALPLMNGTGWPNNVDEDKLKGLSDYYPDDGTEKSVMIHIVEDEQGRICLYRDGQVWESEALQGRWLYKTHTSLAMAEFVDDFDDYTMIHAPCHLGTYIQNRNQPLFKANVKGRFTQMADQYSATPFCALLGVHADGGSQTELSIQDITISGHKGGWTNVGYSPGGAGNDNTDIGGYAMRINEEIMTHIALPYLDTSTSTVQHDMAIGVLPALPLGWVKSKVSRFTGGETDVTLQAYNNFVPFSLKCELSNGMDRYIASSANHTDEGIVVTGANVNGVLDTGFVAMAGMVNRFGEARWTIE